MAKKSFYIFTCSLLGALLFLIIDRIIVFLYLFFVSTGYLASSFDYLSFLLVDYFTLIMVLMFGGWYGVWLGMNWFSMVYENETHGGLVDHITKNLLSSKRKHSLEAKISDVKERIEENLVELENLSVAEAMPMLKQTPKVRRVVRRKVVKKKT